MPRKTAVMSPFLPRYWMEIASSALGSDASEISLRERCCRLRRSALRLSKSTLPFLTQLAGRTRLDACSGESRTLDSDRPVWDAPPPLRMGTSRGLAEANSRDVPKT